MNGSRPANWRKPEAGPSKGSAKISFPTSPTCPSSATPSRSMTRKASRSRANFSPAEGILGWLLDRHAARRRAPLLPPADEKKRRVVTLVCDTGNKYLSKMFNDFWMAEQGFVERPTQGDLSDLISHRHEKGEVISVGPEDTILTAFKRMRSGDISQLPVLNGTGRAVGNYRRVRSAGASPSRSGKI